MDPETIERHIWRAPIERAVLGFRAEVQDAPYFVSDAYIEALAVAENSLTRRHAKVVAFTVFFCAFSLLAAHDLLASFQLSGIDVSVLPFLKEFCMILMAILTSANCIMFMDIYVMSRMRHSIYSITGSEHCNMRMAHIKGDNAWVDSITPKGVGYQSGLAHICLLLVSVLWVFTLPAAFIVLMLFTQIVLFESLSFIQISWISVFAKYFGISVSLLAPVLMLILMAAPLKFKLAEEYSEPDQASVDRRTREDEASGE